MKKIGLIGFFFIFLFFLPCFSTFAQQNKYANYINKTINLQTKIGSNSSFVGNPKITITIDTNSNVSGSYDYSIKIPDNTPSTGYVVIKNTGVITGTFDSSTGKITAKLKGTSKGTNYNSTQLHQYVLDDNTEKACKNITSVKCGFMEGVIDMNGFITGKWSTHIRPTDITGSIGHIPTPTPAKESYIYGKVVTINGKTGFPNVEVSYKVIEHNSTFTGIYKATTDNQGNYSILIPNATIPNGRIQIEQGGEYIPNTIFYDRTKKKQKDMVLATLSEYENEFRRLVADFLNKSGQRSDFVPRLQFKYNPAKTAEYQPSNTIYLGATTDWPKDIWETMYHEVGHLFTHHLTKDEYITTDSCHKLNIYTHEQTAYDEGRAHLISYLILKHLQSVDTALKTNTSNYMYTNLHSFIDDKCPVKYPEKPENVENVVTRFWIDYLNSVGLDCDSQPTSCFARFKSVLDTYHADKSDYFWVNFFKWQNSYPRTLQEWVLTESTKLWTENTSNATIAYSKNLVLKKVLDKHGISSGWFTLFWPSKDAEWGFDPVKQMLTVKQGRIDVTHAELPTTVTFGTGEYSLIAHSSYSIDFSQSVPKIRLKEGLLEVFMGSNKIGEITGKNVYKKITNSSIQDLSNQEREFFNKPIELPEILKEGGLYENKLYKGTFDLFSLLLLVIACVMCAVSVLLVRKKKLLGLFFFFLALGVFFFIGYRYFQLTEVGSDMRNTTDYPPIATSPVPTKQVLVVSKTISPSPTRPEDDPKNNDTSDVVPDSIQYYNCRYHYTFHYAINWTNNATKDSEIAEFFGNKVAVKIQAVPQTETFETFVSNSNKEVGGTLVDQQETERYGGTITEARFNNPEFIARYWQEGEYYMKMVAGPLSDPDDKNDLDSILVTFSINNDQMSVCKEDNNDCSHPNGDVEYWWKSATQEERDCYFQKYGVTPSL